MLIFILLFSMLRSLKGAPAMPSSFFASAGDTLSIITRGDPPTSDGDAENMRTRFSLIQSCFLTIFACVWTAIHPNINGPRDSWWTCFKRKVTTTLIALIAPELILLWALEQCMSAKRIVDKYNTEFALSGVKPKLKDRVVNCFKPLPQPWGDNQQWTMTHGFFIQMGGFLLFKNGDPIEVLDYDRLSTLLRKKAIDHLIITERELQDRSKGDAISKGIVVWQTTWFALQCCARLAQHLPLSELEVVTLAFTVVNVAIYAAWWDKPQSVDTAIRLQLKAAQDCTTGSIQPFSEPTEVDTEKNDEGQSVEFINSTASINSVDNLEPVAASLSEARAATTNDGQSIASDKRPLLSAGKPAAEESWLWRKLRDDRQTHRLPIFLIFRLPYRIISFVWHFVSRKVGEADGFDGKRLRVPMFYAAENSSNKGRYSLAVIGLIFGAIHLIAWGSGFPSRLDQVLWRCASIALVAFPSFTFLLLIISDGDGDVWNFKSKAVKRAFNALNDLIGYGLLIPSLILYIPARLVVIILALKAIQNPSPGIFQDVSWTSFIPHL